MLQYLKRLTTWITITSLIALGMGGVVAQADQAPQAILPKVALIATPTIEMPGSTNTPEDGSYIQFNDVAWSTRGVSTTTTIYIVGEAPVGTPAPTLGSDYLYPRFMNSGATAISLAANTRGTLKFRVPILDDQLLEPDETLNVRIYADSARTRLIGSTSITFDDNEVYANGLRGAASLGTNTTDSLMNAYMLANMANDIYATDSETETAKTDPAAASDDWQQRFTETYSSPEWGWNNVKTYERVVGDTVDTQAATMTNSSAFVIAFRGTQQGADAVSDGLTFNTRVPGTTNVYVHQGFWDALTPVYNSIVAEMKANRGSRIVWITGHSLGGALAQLMAYRIKNSTDTAVNSAVVRVVTFGAPMVGLTAFNNPLNDKSFISTVGAANMQRWVNLMDPVPQVPGLTLPGWTHNSTTTLMKEAPDGSTQVLPGSAMPVPTDTGVEFGNHSMNLYGERIRELTANKFGIDSYELEYFAPEWLYSGDPDPPPEVPADYSALIAGLSITGLLAPQVLIMALVIGVTVFLIVEVLLLLDYVWSEIAPVIEAGYNATAEEIATLMSDFGASVEEIADALTHLDNVTAEEVANVLYALGASYDEIATALHDGFDMTYAAIAQGLEAIGASAEDVADAFVNAFESLDYSSVTGFLVSAGFALADVVAAIDAFFTVTVTQIANVLKTLGKAALEVAEALYDGISATAQAVATALKNVFLATAEAAATVLKAIGVIAADIASLLSTVFSATVNVIAAALKAIGVAIANVATLLKNVLGATITAIAGALKNAFVAAYTTTAALMNAVGSALKTAFTSAYLMIADLFNAIANAVKSAFSALGDAVAKVLNFIGATINQAATALKAAFGAVYDTIATALKTAYSAAASVVASALKAIGATWDNITTALKNAFSSAASTVASVLKSLGASFSAIASAIWNIFATGFDALVAIIDAIGASFTEAWGIVWDLIFG